ncbi:Mo-dependent nitrogenase C-terminal domain-containing protein [Leptolyngbya sp. BC1307]|uniref:Mo-dependent nitrogenase C-terminal domain-containing protein n=1 Tax=Leptolyngbya sp. BC1307 TaxID=2029589 RepID=UPI000EFCCE45|nr:Mo-dependent nitrogenase C-terminal domain-containing protein [Leptolyngbya sp. BC1307]
MTSAIQDSPYTQSQIQVWLRGLLTVAWADGQFDDAEKSIIHTMVESEFAPGIDFATLAPIEPAALATELRLDSAAAQNFLRMAVMVALADGVYSGAESDQIMAFAAALKLDPAALEALQSTLYQLKSSASELTEANEQSASNSESVATSSLHPPKSAAGIDPLKPARAWLDQLSVEDPRLARFVCKLVPSQCPFERDVTLFNRKVVHIPPMCKINPLYEQLVGLRFRALSYLADDCGEDVTAYM